MNQFGPRAAAIGLLAGLILSACVPVATSDPQPVAPSEWASLPDTLACVVDRSAEHGLREIPAKTRGEEIVLLQNGSIQSLEVVHPVNVIAGYAGSEGWLTRGDPITVRGSRYVRTGGERRVGADLLTRSGEHQGILLFSGRDDSDPVDALYIPTAPGCIFQAYVREDLVRD